MFSVPESARQPPKRAAVMVVEDEAIVALDLRQTLEEMGYDVVGVASSADEALSIAEERLPDIALMDIRISGTTDGITAAKWMRDRFDLPVVFLTAHSDAETLARAKDSAPYGYLLKPLKYGELRSTVEVALVRHDLERRVRQRERWFSTTLRSIADAVVAVDVDGCVTFMNRAAEELTGVRTEDALGSRASDVLKLHALDGTALAPLELALKERPAASIREAMLISRNETRRVITEQTSLVEDERGVLGAVMVLRDITQQREDHMKLELAERLASIGTLAAGVAHEINNPLAVIVLNAAHVMDQLMLARPILEAHGGESVDMMGALKVQSDIAIAAQRIKGIVNDLTTFARPGAGQGVACDIQQAVDWAVRSTRHTWEPRTRLEVDLVKMVPVAIDEVRLGQLLVNLIVNATDAVEGRGPDSSIRIRARRHEATAVVEVTDSGVGMTPEQRAHAFDPFFTTKPPGAGMGLGLSICRGIVNTCGGKLEIASEPGKGTTVTATLPLVKVTPRDANAAPARRPPTASLRGRILVVDDEPSILRAIERVLADHDVTSVEDGWLALGLLEKGEPFDLAIFDLMMPRLGGIALYERVAAIRPAFASRVVFATGAINSTGVRAFLDSVPNHCVEKPFSRAALSDVVRSILERGGSD